ncbi:HAMP domain-containing sensor histidine kinase [Dactylosporangium sp. AC04546]|uniref:sensor histidine kinase n=1 Tax=Dactylosporangium sp. AC04546 TaxID=2862460 RepID=UPI001EDF9ED8|nr:HAMP domain-containing sensor histidine kinase [Dactylosporangium sp. AC04546]WVK87321.1 HAMP domain-containing sensor histidine kinase [Dactylosporangium sp. AC04546]
MTGSSADRLRRLRWVLTAVFTATNMLGLVAFAWWMIRDDARQGVARTDAELHRVTASVSRLVIFDQTIDFSLVNVDELNNACPQFAIMPGGAPAFQAHLSGRVCVPMDSAVLSGLAATAVRTGTVVTGYQKATGGGLVRVRVEPLLNQARTPVGAVVAVADMGPEQQRHNRLVLLVTGGLVVLIGGLGLAAHVLSGRAIRPAAAALQQQEVLLAETAHDLRTPVAALRALAETALDNPAQRADLLPRTVRLAVRMGGIIDGLLTRARLAAGVEQLAIQPVWLDQLVAGVVDETPTDGAQVTVTAAPTKVNADPALLQRAIANLLDNAVRYGRQPGAEAIVHITVAGGTITVADHGPGMDAELTDEAFDRFSSTGGSSGLGLSIVRWVAQAHGGTLSVYNADEGGAIFELALPVSPP